MQTRERKTNWLTSYRLCDSWKVVLNIEYSFNSLHFSVTINRFTTTFDDDDSDDEIELTQLNASMSNSQQQASVLYDSLDDHRQELITRLNIGLAQIDQIQPQLINRLNQWKLRQKRTQIGAPFVDAKLQLDTIQIE